MATGPSTRGRLSSTTRGGPRLPRPEAARAILRGNSLGTAWVIRKPSAKPSHYMALAPAGGPALACPSYPQAPQAAALLWLDPGFLDDPLGQAPVFLEIAGKLLRGVEDRDEAQ